LYEAVRGGVLAQWNGSHISLWRLLGVRSGEGYKLPNKNRLNGRPKCAQRIDGEDAWYSDRNDAEIFYLLGWDLETWEEESVIMQESGFLG